MKWEVPFARPEQIAAELRPGSASGPATALRTLREKQALSAGIRRPVRRRKGALRGTVRLYSSLNRDAARAFRCGAIGDARRLASAADELEQSDAALRLAELTAELETEDLDLDVPGRNRVVDLILRDPVANRFAVVLAKSTDLKRREILGGNTPRTIFGTVAAGRHQYRVVKVDGTDEQFALDSDESDPTLATTGASVCLRFEVLSAGSHQMLFTVEPAIEAVPEERLGSRRPDNRRNSSPMFARRETPLELSDADLASVSKIRLLNVLGK